MASQKKPTGKPEPKKEGKHRKQKQPTQKTPMQRIVVMGPTGKTHLEWRPWPEGKSQ